MEWLNYHHLLYFWMVGREGSVSRAARELRLAQPTVSGQIRALEDRLGEKLFQRAGRRLVLTDTGQMVYRYADEIFGLGRELLAAVQGRPSGRSPRFTVGIADVVPKLIAHRLLEPALRMPGSLRLVCHEAKPSELLGELALHRLDLVISDAPVGADLHVRAFHHLLGECGVSFLASRRFAARLRRGFPRSLDAAPMILPTPNTTLRRALDQWLESEALRPRVVAEFEDSALLKTFGQAGHGVFPVPSAIESEVCRQFRVRVVGRSEAVRERFYAISVQRRLTHPAVLAITQAARERLFA